MANSHIVFTLTNRHIHPAYSLDIKYDDGSTTITSSGHLDIDSSILSMFISNALDTRDKYHVHIDVLEEFNIFEGYYYNVILSVDDICDTILDKPGGYRVVDGSIHLVYANTSFVLRAISKHPSFKVYADVNLERFIIINSLINNR